MTLFGCHVLLSLVKFITIMILLQEFFIIMQRLTRHVSVIRLTNRVVSLFVTTVIVSEPELLVPKPLTNDSRIKAKSKSQLHIWTYLLSYVGFTLFTV